MDTFRKAFPWEHIADNTITGCIAEVTEVPGFAAMEITTEARGGVIVKAREAGWAHIGQSNLLPARPTFVQTYTATATTVPVPGTWSAPTVTTSFVGVLGVAAANADLITVAGWVGLVKNQVVQHDSDIDTAFKLINKIVDTLEAFGMAVPP
jgi:uncharacterized membrane protein